MRGRWPRRRCAGAGAQVGSRRSGRFGTAGVHVDRRPLITAISTRWPCSSAQRATCFVAGAEHHSIHAGCEVLRVWPKPVGMPGEVEQFDHDVSSTWPIQVPSTRRCRKPPRSPTPQWCSSSAGSANEVSRSTKPGSLSVGCFPARPDRARPPGRRGRSRDWGRRWRILIGSRGAFFGCRRRWSSVQRGGRGRIGGDGRRDYLTALRSSCRPTARVTRQSRAHAAPTHAFIRLVSCSRSGAGCTARARKERLLASLDVDLDSADRFRRRPPDAHRPPPAGAAPGVPPAGRPGRSPALNLRTPTTGIGPALAARRARGCGVARIPWRRPGRAQAAGPVRAPAPAPDPPITLSPTSRPADRRPTSPPSRRRRLHLVLLRLSRFARPLPLAAAAGLRADAVPRRRPRWCRPTSPFR